MSEPIHWTDKFSFKRIFLTGLITIVPLWVTWLIIAFLFKTLSEIGKPLVDRFTQLLEPRFPNVELYLSNEVLWSIISVLLVIGIIYSLGLLTMMVVGRKLVALFEAILDRVPLVRHVYRAVKKLTTVLQEKPAGDVQRVVLIEFPSKQMKTVGLVTRVLDDSQTGRKLAAVYVPTTPNPTSGYLEIVPIERLTQTNWTMDEAMNFIVSGGAVAPDRIFYDGPPPEEFNSEPKE